MLDKLRKLIQSRRGTAVVFCGRIGEGGVVAKRSWLDGVLRCSACGSEDIGSASHPFEGFHA